ncbi:hypothetical protein LINGRAHAP2_LOCUS30949 [Linum grandiflorum]
MVDKQKKVQEAAIEGVPVLKTRKIYLGFDIVVYLVNRN